MPVSTSTSAPRLPPPAWDELSLFEQLALMPKDVADDILKDLIRRGVDPQGFQVVLRPNQLEIVNDHESWISIFSAGRGAGKTFSGAGWVDERARKFPGCRIILLGRTVADVRDVMIDGEALALDTLIPTPNGWTTMGDVKVGDLVIGSNGLPTKVVWASSVVEGRPCYRVTFKDGESIVADENHKWLTETHQTRRSRGRGPKHRPSVTTTGEIRDTLKHQNQINHAVRNINPLNFSTADLPIPPYTLGVWLGDGHTHHAAFTTMDQEVISGVIDDGFSVRLWSSSKNNGKARAYGVLGLSKLLKKEGLIGNKYVPQKYLRGSYSQRLSLLQGLIDTDGYVSKRGEIEFCNTNKNIAMAVKELVYSLGHRAHVSIKITGKYLPLYRVNFRTGLPVTTIKRKMERLCTPKSREANYRYIKSVVATPSVPVRCIAVDSDDCLFAVGRTYVLTHNSGIIAKSSPDFMPVYTPSRRIVEWPNGSSAQTFSADSPSQLRGPQGHFAWADELAAFPTIPDNSGATAWDNCLMATRLGETPQILITTTPKRTGVMREIYQMADNDPLVVLHQASTLSNRANLSAGYIEAIFNKYGGTHLEQQELYGALVGDAPGALWRASDIVLGQNDDPEVKTIKVIGVDPSVEAGGDNTGIVLAEAAIDREIMKRRAWVLEDRTMDGSPDQWAAQVHNLWSENPGSIVVVEGNQGGQLLRMVLHQLDSTMPVAIVKAIRSKAMRAEPIVMAYRQGRVEHTKHFPLLEEEMTGWEPGVSRWSPGSVDALVWAMTVLLVDERPLYPYTPLIFTPPSQEKVPILVPKYRDDRKALGMGLSPWRRKR